MVPAGRLIAVLCLATASFMTTLGGSSEVELAQVRKVGVDVTEISADFDAPPARVFAALTESARLSQWMSATGFELASAEVDAREGGGFRYAFRRPSGRSIEVRGSYVKFVPPRGYAYLESYDFSPLTIDVEVALEAVAPGTRYTQTLRYKTEKERDDDFEGVAASTREALAKLALYLRASGTDDS